MKSFPLIFGADHAGFELKQHLVQMFPQTEIWDCGTHSKDSVDYPDFAERVCQKVLALQTKGVLICGSGQGMAMSANHIPGIRAALCWTSEVARLSREHNDANVLCLGARFLTTDEASEILKTFLTTPFAEGRHLCRVQKIEKLSWNY